MPKPTKAQRERNKWKTVPDENVRHVWAESDGSHEITVDPTYYQENGTPTCTREDSEDFEQDLTYVRTEIKS